MMKAEVLSLANPKYNRKTSEERKQEIQAISKKALQQIEKYTKSVEDVLEYADFMSRFHSYSANNLALIQQQFSGAEAVASFKDWKDKGYSVQKGEKGIQILSYAPVTLFKDANGEMKQLSQATQQEKKLIKDGQIPTRKIANFKVGHVFDISQTNAPIEDLPKIFPNKQFNFQIEEGRNAEHLRKGIEAVSKELNIDIRDMRQSELGVTELGASKGAFVQGKDGKGKEIVMNSRNTETQALATSIHELAHAKLHIKGGEFDNMERATKEFQAELTSYIVCKHFGMDTSEKAIPYIATWTQNGEKIEDKQKALEGVHKTAKEFIEIMDTVISEEKEKEMQVENEQETKPEFNDRQLHYMSNILIADEASLRKGVNTDPWSKSFYENLKNETVERTQAVERHLNQHEINQVMQEVNVYRNDIDAKEEFNSTNLYELVRGKDIPKFKELKDQIKGWQEESNDINPIPGIEEEIFRDKIEYNRIDTYYDKDDNDRKALTRLQTRIELNNIKVQESEFALRGEYSITADQEIKQEEVKMYPIDPKEAIYCELTGKAIPDDDIYFTTHDGKSLSEEAKMLMYTDEEWTKSTENGNYQTFNFYSIQLSNSEMTSKDPEPRIDNKNEYYFYDGQSKPVKLGTVSDIVSIAQNQEPIDHFSLDKEFIRDLAFFKDEPKEEFNEKMQKYNVLKNPKLKDFQQVNERLGLGKDQNLLNIKNEAGRKAQLALKMCMQR